MAPFAGLAEALDNNLRPLCMLKVDDILAQGLAHRAAALLISDREGRRILRASASGEWGFTAAAPVAAGMALDDCRILLAESWPSRLYDWRSPAVIQPCEETGRAQVHIFEAKCARVPAGDDLLPLARGEYDALLARGYPVSPLLKLAVDSGAARWP